MKIRRKTNRCLNCNSKIDQIYNFCPYCGQENTNRNVSFKDLIREFFNNYLSFDSKFGRSIKPFFLSPGKLTNEFINGRRVNYANPIRLYLILSLFYFFALSQFNTYKNDDAGQGSIKFSTASGKEVKALADSIAKDPEKIINQMLVDSIAKDPSKIIDQIPKSEKESLWPFQTRENLKKYLKYRQDLTVSDQELYDTLYIDGMSTIDELALKQTIRLGRAKNKEMMGYVIEQMPFLMFLMLPIFAMLMKLLYVRRNHNYIVHLVHSLHQHSFKFFLLGFATIIGLFVSQPIAATLIIGAFIISLIYIYLSFINVYQQGYFKTFLKFGMYYFVYAILLSFGLVFEMLISLALY
ncbi:MAG: DUF3667 domain-containing protein [Bacteroidota bacterium]